MPQRVIYELKLRLVHLKPVGTTEWQEELHMKANVGFSVHARCSWQYIVCRMRAWECAKTVELFIIGHSLERCTHRPTAHVMTTQCQKTNTTLPLTVQSEWPFGYRHLTKCVFFRDYKQSQHVPNPLRVLKVKKTCFYNKLFSKHDKPPKSRLSRFHKRHTHVRYFFIFSSDNCTHYLPWNF